MTISRVKATGKGTIHARLVIEGYDVSFVSSKRMELVETGGRRRVAGLVLDGLVLGARGDLIRSKVVADPVTFRVVDLDRGSGRFGEATRRLLREPTVRAFLSSSISRVATTIGLVDVTGLPSSGLVYIGTETIRYTGISGNQLTGCTRGVWSWPQAHFVADGFGREDAQVTDAPLGVEGRRCFLYVYGEGDSPTGPGHLFWRGVCSSDVAWRDGEIAIQADPITRILDQHVSSSAGQQVSIRGIFYSRASAFGVEVFVPSIATTVVAKLHGFFASQADFCDAVNAQVSATLSAHSISLGGGSIVLSPTPEGFDLRYTTGATPVVAYCRVFSQIDVEAGSAPINDDSPWWHIHGGNWRSTTSVFPIYWGSTTWVPTSMTTYYQSFFSPVPRASLVGRRLGWSSDTSPSDAPRTQTHALYFGDLIVPSIGDYVGIKKRGETHWIRCNDPDTTLRMATIERDYRLFPWSRIVFARGSPVQSVLGYLDDLRMTSADTANAGATPIIHLGEVDWSSDVEDYVNDQELVRARMFLVVDGKVTLAELVTPEFQAAGLYCRLSTTGSLEIKRLSAGEFIGEAQFVIDRSAAYVPELERSSRGVVSAVTYKYAYNPEDDSWLHSITYRDVQTTSAIRTARSIEVAQRSLLGFGDPTGESMEDEAIARHYRSSMRDIAVRILSLFGQPYRTLRFSLDARYMDARIGDRVDITTPFLPDSDGSTPLASKRGVVVGHSIDLSTGEVELDVLVLSTTPSGYAPAFPITSSSHVTGTTYDVTVTIASYTDAPTVAEWFAPGDLIRVCRLDNKAASISGSVVSVISPTVVRVNLGSSWTPGAHEWSLRTAPSTSLVDGVGLGKWCFQGNTSRRLVFSTSNTNARVFS